MAANQRMWSTAEVAVLQQHYETASHAQLLEGLPGRAWASIREKAQRLGLRRRSGENHWSPEDEALVRAHYATRGGHYLAKQLGRTHAAVLKKAAKLGLRLEAFGKQPRKTNWSEAHLGILRAQYPTQGPEVVAPLVGRNPASVVSMAKRLGIRCRLRPAGRPRWSAEHTALLTEHYPAGRPIVELMQLLGRKADAIVARAGALGLKRPKRLAVPQSAKAAKPGPVTIRTWSLEADQALRTHFPDMDNSALGQLLGRTEYAVRARAHELKLKKSEAFLAARAAVLAEQRLIKKKAQRQVEKKAKAPAKAPAKKWFHYPMGSPEYQAGLAATTAGKQRATIIDENGRPATVWRNAA